MLHSPFNVGLFCLVRLKSWHLPLLGWLFRSKTDQFEKINLLIFIRPTIIRTKADLQRVNKRASSRFKKAKELNKVSSQVLEDMGLPELSDKAEKVTE